MKILFASQNQHKIEEVSKLLPSSISILGLNDLNFKEDIEESENTIEGNALLKARFVHEKFAIACFADDTGLFIESLNGEPGVYSARWSQNDDRFSSNIEKALTLLKGEKNRKAYFKTVIAYIDDKEEKLFEGRIDGKIIDHLKGEGGFGYDPIFVPDSYTKSFGEMSSEEKNKISHRALAMQAFNTFLIKKGN